MVLVVAGASRLAYGCSAGISADVTAVSVYAGNFVAVKVERVVVVVPVVGDYDVVWIAAAAVAVGVAAAADVAAVGVDHDDVAFAESAAAVFAGCAAKFEAEVVEDLTGSSTGALVGHDLFGWVEDTVFGGRTGRRIGRAPSSSAECERTTW